MKLLVGGTRGAKLSYEEFVLIMKEKVLWFGKPSEILEGCCPDSADIFAERWAKELNITIKHFPANTGNYLQRNIEMVESCDEAIYFWNGFSYGSAQSIAQAVLQSKPVKVIKVET